MNYGDNSMLVSELTAYEKNYTDDELRFLTLAFQAYNAAYQLNVAHEKFLDHAKKMSEATEK